MPGHGKATQKGAVSFWFLEVLSESRQQKQNIHVGILWYFILHGIYLCTVYIYLYMVHIYIESRYIICILSRLEDKNPIDFPQVKTNKKTVAGFLLVVSGGLHLHLCPNSCWISHGFLEKEIHWVG